MEPTEKQLLFSPKAFQKLEEKPDLTTAWAYIIIDGPLDKDPKNWPKQIIRAGQCATIVPKARMEKQKYEWLKKGRLEEIEKAKLLVVKRFDGPKAESSSIEWEFLIHAHRAKMSLESGPGQFKDEREYKSIYSFLAATNPSDELKVEVSRALTDVLYLESEGKYVEDPFRFECPKPNCDKTFEQLCHLQSHEKTHGDLTLSHECHQCGNAYSEKSALKRHLENDHSQEKQREIRKRQSSGRQEPYTCPEPKDEKCEKFKANDYKDFRKHLTTKKHGYVDKQVRAKYPQKQIRRRPAIENENIADLFSDVSEGEMDERNRYLATMDEDDSPPSAKIPRVEDDGPGTFSNSNRPSPYSI